MTRLPLRALALAGALLSILPVASAGHWTYTYNGEWADFLGTGCWYSDANCMAADLCTGGAPPQIVDLALYCAGRLANGADDAASWSLDFAWFQADAWTYDAEHSPSRANDATATQRSQVNAVLCGQVWSFFCTNPIALPEHVPVADPIGPNPLP